MHPAGSYDARIIDHGYSTSRGSGSEQFFAVFETEAGAITGYFSMTDKAITYTIEKIRNMGFQGRDLMQLADGITLKDHMCTITVEHEMYEGKQQVKVGFVNPLGQSGGNIERDDVAAKNSRRFNALLSQKPAIKPVLAQDTQATRDAPREEQPPLYDDNDQGYSESYDPGQDDYSRGRDR